MAYIATLAPAAAQDARRLHARAAVLPRLGQVWCENARPEAQRHAGRRPTRTRPAAFRVNGVVSNMPEFQKAFSCKADAPMVRQKPAASGESWAGRRPGPRTRLTVGLGPALRWRRSTSAIVSCELCPRLAATATHRARKAPRVSRRDLLGQARAGLRRPARAPAARRSRAGRPRRQPHRPGVHRRRRRRIRRLSDVGASSRRVRQPRHVPSPRRRAEAERRVHRGGGALRPAGQQADAGRDRRCLPHLDAEIAALPRVRVVVALGQIASTRTCSC